METRLQMNSSLEMLIHIQFSDVLVKISNEVTSFSMGFLFYRGIKTSRISAQKEGCCRFLSDRLVMGTKQRMDTKQKCHKIFENIFKTYSEVCTCPEYSIFLVKTRQRRFKCNVTFMAPSHWKSIYTIYTTTDIATIMMTKHQFSFNN